MQWLGDLSQGQHCTLPVTGAAHESLLICTPAVSLLDMTKRREEPPKSLEDLREILLHVGHLDVVRELIDGAVGE